MNINTYYSNPRKTVRTSDSTGFFFDDQWAPSKRLTFNLGARYDIMTAKFGKGQILAQPTTPEGFAGTLRRHPGPPGLGEPVQLPIASLPRLGVTYQLTKDGKTALRASLGDPPRRSAWRALESGGPDQDRSYSTTKYYLVPWEGLDANGDGVIFDSETMNATRRLLEGVQDRKMTPLNGEFTANNGGNLDYRNTFAIYDPSLTPFELKIQPGMKNQHTDQFTVSLERELFKNFSMALAYRIRRNPTDMIVE